MSKNPNQVTRSKRRRTARVTMLEDGSIWSAPVGQALEVYIKKAFPHWVPSLRPDQAEDQRTICAAIVDGTLRELSYCIDRDAEVAPVFLDDSDGLRIYRRALSLVLIVAAAELFPGRRIAIDYSLPFGGFYCAVLDSEPFSTEELAQIKARMQEIIQADEPITRRAVPLDEAIALFTQRGDDDKLRLMESRGKDYLILYELRGVRDYFYGYMLPSTGYLSLFDLTHDGDGFVLHYPRRSEPECLQPITTLPKLRAIFEETGHWLTLLGIPDVGALNQAIRAGRMRELILAAEALHEGRFADIADAIAARKPAVRLVLIAGPSSSGKTTSSKRLAVQLLAHGLRPYTLGLDNYFVDRKDTPRDETGDFDYEHLNTVDLDLFNEQLLALMDGQEVQIPVYDFLKGERSPGDKAQLTAEHIIIVEGIHGLNPELVRDIPEECVFRLYVSCLTQLNVDYHNRISTTDVRLLRRIVRDAEFRGYSALDTLSRWASVRRGEHQWIFPYQENADMMFNSALVYELAVLRPLVVPLLLQVERSSLYHIEAKRLLSFLGWVEPVKQSELVPDNSILREFIGGSILQDYLPGKPSPAGDVQDGR